MDRPRSDSVYVVALDILRNGLSISSFLQTTICTTRQSPKYFTTIMEARVLQLCTKLKTTKKFNSFASEFVFQIKIIVDSLLLVGDSINEQYQIDVMLDGLLEEYTPFIMQVYGRPKSRIMYDVEVRTFSFQCLNNLVQHKSTLTDGAYSFCGRGRNFQVRGCGHLRGGALGLRPICQLCGKYDNVVLDC